MIDIPDPFPIVVLYSVWQTTKNSASIHSHFSFSVVFPPAPASPPGFTSPSRVHEPTNTSSFLCSGPGFGISICAIAVAAKRNHPAKIIARVFSVCPRDFIVLKTIALSLPVSKMRHRHLLKLHLPHVPLLHPRRAEMLIPRRWPLILRRRNAQYHIVGDDRDPVRHRHDFHVVREQVEPAAAHAVNKVLAVGQLAVERHERKVVSEGALEKCHIALFRSLNITLFGSHQSLLQRTQRLGRRICLPHRGDRQGATKQNHA